MPGKCHQRASSVQVDPKHGLTAGSLLGICATDIRYTMVLMAKKRPKLSQEEAAERNKRNADRQRAIIAAAKRMSSEQREAFREACAAERWRAEHEVKRRAPEPVNARGIAGPDATKAETTSKRHRPRRAAESWKRRLIARYSMRSGRCVEKLR